MKYSDELDRISPTDGLSRRQFLTAGGHHAARLAAGVIAPGAGNRLLDASSDAPAPDDTEEQSDRRDG
jgi:hypothetical protein